MRRLTLIAASGDAERLRAGLEVAASAAALGRPVRMFLQGPAVRLFDEPGLAALLEEARALGLAITACQTALAAAELRADELPAGVETSGLIALLAGAEDDQLLMI